MFGMLRMLSVGLLRLADIHDGAEHEKYHVTEKNKNKVFLVRSSPFEVCGQMCVMLEGYTGCYALDGLKKVKGGTEDA